MVWVVDNGNNDWIRDGSHLFNAMVTVVKERNKPLWGEYNEDQRAVPNALLYYPGGIHIFNHSPHILDGKNNWVHCIFLSINPIRITTEKEISS